MLLQLNKVLSPEILSNIRQVLDNAKYVDGKLSAGSAAQRVKHNEELDPQSQQAEYLDNLLMQHLAQHPDFRNGALPHKVSRPYFARYQQGKQYGDHIDDPVMGSDGERFRCDIAVTVFLNEPESYTGGELVINTTFGQRDIKLPAGDAILYPASSLHHVVEVTQGERQVVVLWVQSLVRDPAKRELLYELNQARETLLREQPDAATTAQVDHSYVNLVRRWCEV